MLLICIFVCLLSAYISVSCSKGQVDVLCKTGPMTEACSVLFLSSQTNTSQNSANFVLQKMV